MYTNCLQLIRKHGKPPAIYELKVGSHTIGTSILADIRLKSKIKCLEPVLCVINVNSNGLATLERTNENKDIILINGSKMTKIHFLKNDDLIDIAGKQFRYVNNNNNSLPAEISNSIKLGKRQSIMPSFKIGTPSHIPILTRRKDYFKRSLTTVKLKKELSRRSCLSALPVKTKRSLCKWQTYSPSDIKASLRPSTSMQENNNLSVAVRKALFLKQKGDVSFADAKSSRKSESITLLSLDDTISSMIQEYQPPIQGGKRRRSTDSIDNRLAKRRKHSEDHLVFVSISGSEKLFDTSNSSLEKPCQSSTLATTVYEILTNTKAQTSPLNDSTDIGGIKKVLKSPKVQKSANDLSDVKGAKNIFKTLKVQQSLTNELNDVRGVKKILKTPKTQKSPANDLTDVRGVKKIMRTPKVQKSPINDLTKVEGVKKLMKTPKEQKPPRNDLSNVRGVKKLMTTPKVQKSPLNDLTNVKGVKKIFKTPKQQKSPLNDLRNVDGVKKLMKTPKDQKSPLNELTDVRGVKKLMRTPKAQISPTNDLTDVRGVQKLFKTPKEQKSPVSDLRNVSGVKNFFKTAIVMKSPVNDLTDVSGVKTLFKSPKIQKFPSNDLTDVRGVKKILKTPKIQKSPLKDLSNVPHIKTMLKTPKLNKVLKSPTNILTDWGGIKKLLTTPNSKIQKLPKNDLTDVEGVKELFLCDQSLERVCQEFLNNSDVHNSSKNFNNKSPKTELCATPNLKIPKEQEEVQLSQRGRRIRLKRFNDDFVLSPLSKSAQSASPKRVLRSRKQKTVVDVSKQQISVNDGNVETPNLKIRKEEAVEMPIQNLRGRKKNAAIAGAGVEEVDTPGGSARSARGGRKKNNEQAPDTPNTYKEEKVVAKRGRRKKNPAEEVLPEGTLDATEDDESNVQTKPNTRSGCGRKVNNNQETSKTRKGQNHNQSGEGHVGTPKVEETIKEEEKRSVRGRKKTEEVKNDEQKEVVNENRTRGGRKRKNAVEEIKDALVTETPKAKKIALETQPKRGKSKKNVTEEEKPTTLKVTTTRSKRRVAANAEVPNEEKTSRKNKRKNIENNEKATEIEEDLKNKEISPMKTRRGRRAKV